MGPSPIEVSFWRRRQRGAVPGEGLEPRVRPWNLEGEHRAKQTPRAEGAWPVERPGGPAWLERESGRGGGYPGRAAGPPDRRCFLSRAMESQGHVFMVAVWKDETVQCLLKDRCQDGPARGPGHPGGFETKEA